MKKKKIITNSQKYDQLVHSFRELLNEEQLKASYEVTDFLLSLISDEILEEKVGETVYF